MRIFSLSCLLVALHAFVLWGQTTTPDETISLDFECTDCDLGVKINLVNNSDCSTSTLDLQLEIEGEYDAIEWEGTDPIAGTGGMVNKNTGIYTVTVKKGEACTATSTFDTDIDMKGEAIMQNYFEDNCFISIPVTYEGSIGGSGIRNNRASARNDDLIVSIERLGTVNVADIFAAGNLTAPTCSSDCPGSVAGLEAYEGGGSWAHVVGDGDAAILFLGTTAANNDAGQAMADAYYQFWTMNSAEDPLTAPINYTCGAKQFLNSGFGDKWLEYLLALLECDNYDPKGGEGKGIVPHCFWKEAPTPFSYYGVTDIPFSAGVIDGGAQMIQDLPQFFMLLDDLRNLGVAIYSYLPCHALGLDEDFYKELENKLPEPSWLDRAKSLLNQALSLDRVDCNNSIQTVNKIIETFEQVQKFLDDRSAVILKIAQIVTKLEDYLEEFTDCSTLIKCNNARYEHGKVAINLLSIAFGIGVEDGLAKMGTIIARFSTKQVDEFFAFAASKSGRVKGLSGTRKIAMKEIMDVLPPKTWNKVVDDPELLDVWTRLAAKACPILVGRNSTNDCKALRIKLFSELDGKLIKKFEADAADDAFYKYFADNNDQADNWKKFASTVSESKAWVRKNVDLYKRIKSKNLTSSQVDNLASFYKNIKIARPREILEGGGFRVTKGDVTITYNKFGFPDFDSYIPSPKSEFAIEVTNPWKGRNADISSANNQLKAKYDQPNNNLPQEYIRGKGNNFTIKDPVSGKEVKYTWHHHQDGETLIPVPREIHNNADGGFAHSGGDALLSFNNGLDGFFDGPNLSGN